VKNFQDKLDEPKLIELFSKFGEITSVKVPLDESGKPRGFGFINYKNPDDATKVIKKIFLFNPFFISKLNFVSYYKGSSTNE
jgi:polyadenylate-binding protein